MNGIFFQVVKMITSRKLHEREWCVCMSRLYDLGLGLADVTKAVRMNA